MLSAALAHVYCTENDRDVDKDKSNKSSDDTGECVRTTCLSDDARGIAGEVAQTSMGQLENGRCGVSSNSKSGGKSDRSLALTLSFFARTVRALERHLAPITVPSPLVRCTRVPRYVSMVHSIF